MFVPRHTRWLRMPGKARSPAPVWVSPRDVQPDEPGIVRMPWTVAYFLLRDWIHDPELFRHLTAMFVHLGGELDPTPCTQDDEIAPIERAFEEERLWLWHVPPFAVSEPAVFPSVTGPGTNPTEPGSNLGLTWIEISLVDLKGRPCPNEAVELTLSDGRSVQRATNESGITRFDSIPAGSCEVTFPSIDGREWARRRQLPRSPKDYDGPIATTHVVRPGDCFASVAADHGFRRLATLYCHQANSELRRKRPNPNLLAPDDMIAIPERDYRYDTAPTGTRTEFEAAIDRTMLRLVFAGKREHAYRLIVDGQVLEGRVDRDGLIEAKIPPTLQQAVLEFPDAAGNATSSYQLRVGKLDPIEQTRGVQSRLNNLGFPCIVDGIAGPKTAAALRCYQRWAGLQETGVADDATRAHLVSTHDGG